MLFIKNELMSFTETLIKDSPHVDSVELKFIGSPYFFHSQTHGNKRGHADKQEHTPTHTHTHTHTHTQKDTHTQSQTE